MRLLSKIYLDLPLKVHEFLAGVPLHDAWSVALIGGSKDLQLRDLGWLLDEIGGGKQNIAVRFLFALRNRMGKWFRWDSDRAVPPILPDSYIHRLDEGERTRSAVAPGTYRSPFHVVYVFDSEALVEIINQTVHAFAHVSLHPTDTGYRIVLAIYVIETKWWTKWYMALIDPFRNWIIYPSLIRSVEKKWAERYG